MPFACYGKTYCSFLETAGNHMWNRMTTLSHLDEPTDSHRNHRALYSKVQVAHVKIEECMYFCHACLAETFNN